MTGLQSFQVPVPIHFTLVELINGTPIYTWFDTVFEYTFGGGPSGLVGNFTADEAFGNVRTFEATWELLGHPMPVVWVVTLESYDSNTSTVIDTTTRTITLTEGTSPVTETFAAPGSDTSLYAISETWTMPA